MKTVVGVIAVLVTVGLAALGLLTAQRLFSPPNHVAGPAFPNSDQGTSATAASPSSVMTPWPDLEDLTTSAPTAARFACATASTPTSSPSGPATSTARTASSTARRSSSTPRRPAQGAISPHARSPTPWGFSRVVEIDTTGGPKFGLQYLKGNDFLRDKEVVLTFDDGPRPVSTVAVLKALQDECVKATFFEIGQPAI